MPLPFPRYVSQRLRPHGLRLYLYLGLGLLAFVLLAGGMGTSLLIQAKLEEKAREDIRALGRHGAHQGLILALMDQELGLRGYLATGDPAFLAPYERGRKAEEDALHTIMANLHPSDRGFVEVELLRLDALLVAWHGEVAGPLIDARGRGPLADLREAMGRGRAQFDAVRAHSDRLERILDERDSRRIVQLERAVLQARWLSGLGIAAFLVVGMLVVRWIRRRVAKPMMELAEEARSGLGFLSPLEAHPVREVDILRHALAQLDERVRERERSLQEEREEVLAVQAFTRVVQEVREEDELLDTLAQALQRLVKPDRLRLNLRLGTGEILQYRPRAGEAEETREDEEAQLRMTECRVFRRMAPVGLDADDPVACRCPQGLTAEGSHLCLPMLVAGEALGLVQLLAHLPGHWTPERRRVAEACVSAATAALQAVRALRLAEERSIRDGLTGIYNRRFLDEMLPKLLDQAQRTGQTLSVIMVDLDHFKRINDLHGHETGDRVLALVAGGLGTRIRSGDMVARYGGEEFALLLPNTPHAVGLSLAERLRAGVEALPLPSPPFPEGLRLSASLGVATFPEHGSTGEALLAAADKALYLAKGSGRNIVMGAEELM